MTRLSDSELQAIRDTWAVQPGDIADVIRALLGHIDAFQGPATVEQVDPDDRHNDGSLVDAAICYALAGQTAARGHDLHEWFGSRASDGGVKPPALWRWPWAASAWKPANDPIHNLTRAGALIAAEIDRLRRASATTEVDG